MDGTPVHDWLAPRIAALLEEATRQGFERDVALAVMLDIIETGIPAAPAAPPA